MVKKVPYLMMIIAEAVILAAVAGALIYTIVDLVTYLAANNFSFDFDMDNTEGISLILNYGFRSLLVLFALAVCPVTIIVTTFFVLSLRKHRKEERSGKYIAGIIFFSTLEILVYTAITRFVLDTDFPVSFTVLAGYIPVALAMAGAILHFVSGRKKSKGEPSHPQRE